MAGVPRIRNRFRNRAVASPRGERDLEVQLHRRKGNRAHSRNDLHGCGVGWPNARQQKWMQHQRIRGGWYRPQTFAVHRCSSSSWRTRIFPQTECWRTWGSSRGAPNNSECMFRYFLEMQLSPCRREERPQTLPPTPNSWHAAADGKALSHGRTGMRFGGRLPGSDAGGCRSKGGTVPWPDCHVH